MELGTFSISLAVKDLQQSINFYQKLGFRVFAGETAENWSIMKNGDCAIGLFQGMFDNNIMTFNPGWDNDANAKSKFTDIRQLQAQLKQHGIELVSQVDEDSSGPGSFMIADPDGNTILFDQHV